MIDPTTGLPYTNGDPNAMQITGSAAGSIPNKYLKGKATGFVMPSMPTIANRDLTGKALIHGMAASGSTTPVRSDDSTMTRGSGSLFGNFDSMSDNELFSMAQSMGIDPNQFMGGQMGGGGNENLDMFQIDPAVSRAVSQIYQSQRDLGNDQLQRSAIEMAGGRGLNTTDTPIWDPFLRNQASFESQLRGNEASTTLGLAQDYNKQRDTFLSGLFNTQQGLQQAAAANRMALTDSGNKVGQGLNLARMNRPTGSSVTTSGLSASQLSNGVGAIGAGLNGLSGLLGGSNGLLGGLGGILANALGLSGSSGSGAPDFSSDLWGDIGNTDWTSGFDSWDAGGFGGADNWY